jgi:hypothetical protein
MEQQTTTEVAGPKLAATVPCSGDQVQRTLVAAAASDLLAALKHLLIHIERRNLFYERGEDAEVRQMALAAIAKAEECETAGQDAADVLEAIAAGHTPNRAALLAGALKLDALTMEGSGDRDLLDAAAALKLLATGGTLELDDAGRARAAWIAAHLRQLEGDRP